MFRSTTALAGAARHLSRGFLHMAMMTDVETGGARPVKIAG
jgi:hypothetical protein